MEMWSCGRERLGIWSISLFDLFSPLFFPTIKKTQFCVHITCQTSPMYPQSDKKTADNFYGSIFSVSFNFKIHFKSQSKCSNWFDFLQKQRNKFVLEYDTSVIGGEYERGGDGAESFF